MLSFLETIIHNINGWTFNDIEKADLVAFPVCADGFIERNFSGTFPAGTEHHEKLIVNAPCSISGQAWKSGWDQRWRWL